ncbi:hypothetical protein NBRGN_091_00810 [Nocardia brasiliensis NBRC 14402]|nr:hypothetical protein NBRGN_091_00810 [Nocardia brasiliensis NBRC 14402]
MSVTPSESAGSRVGGVADLVTLPCPAALTAYARAAGSVSCGVAVPLMSPDMASPGRRRCPADGVAESVTFAELTALPSRLRLPSLSVAEPVTFAEPQRRRAGYVCRADSVAVGGSVAG